MFRVVRSDEEINDLLNKCGEAEEKGMSKYPGMTYEQGIRQALAWLEYKDEDHPLED